jgi:hypothetical protein
MGIFGPLGVCIAIREKDGLWYLPRHRGLVFRELFFDAINDVRRRHGNNDADLDS